MKVLQITKFYPPALGGIETITHELTNYLNEQGIICDVLCTNHDKGFHQEEGNNYTIYRSRSYGTICSTSISPHMIWQLKSLIPHYSLLHVHLPNPMANLAIYLLKPKIPIVLHWHSDILSHKILLKYYYPLLKWLMREAQLIITTSPKYTNGSLFLRSYLHKVRSISIGIETKQLQADPTKVFKIKNKLRNRKIIFSLGRLTYYKGHEYLIEAGKYLDDSYVILIGGNGALMKNLKKKINKENLYNMIVLLGEIPKSLLGSYYQAPAIFFVYPPLKNLRPLVLSYWKPCILLNQ